MIEKTKKIDFDSFTIFLRKYSVITAHFCNYLWLTPNEVTVMRVIIFWVWSCILLFLENYWLNILWLLFLFLYYFFDLVDWDLARNYNKKTLLWKFLDENLDAFILNFIIFTLSLKILIFNYGDIYVIWGLLALFWSILWAKMWNIIENNFSISCVEGNKIIDSYYSHNKIELASKLIYWFMVPKTFLDQLLTTFRYYIIIGIVLDRVGIFLLISWVMSILRWIILFLIIARYYSSKDKYTSISLFRLMKEQENII